MNEQGGQGKKTWDEFRELLFSQIATLIRDVEEVNKKFDTMRDENRDEINGMKIEIALLKQKMAIIGAGSGAVAALIVGFVPKLLGH